MRLDRDVRIGGAEGEDVLPLLPDAQRVWKARHVLPSAEEVVALATHLAVKYRLSFVILEQRAMRVSEVVSLERDVVDAAGLRP